MTQEDEILELQNELIANPKSPQFVKLAEIYLFREMVEEAEAVVKQGLKFHPRSTSGLILMGRTLKLKKAHQEATRFLTDATKLAPDNWRAWLELADAYLELKQGKSALHAYKKVLFINPNHPLARRAVARLELLTADEYEEELFQMHKLPETSLEAQDSQEQTVNKWTKPGAALTRALSYIDALIVRHEIEKSIELLNECTNRYGDHPEIEARRLKLSVFERADYIKPKSAAKISMAKQRAIKEKQIEVLHELLRRIEDRKSQLLSD